MACPYFYPVARAADEGAIPPRLPLGGAFDGECRASETAIHPDPGTMHKWCNAGYGRGACPFFPEDAAVDAVRFHIAANSDNVVRLQWIFEKGCWPVDSGFTDYSIADAKLDPVLTGAVLNRQAVVFIQSCLERLR